MNNDIAALRKQGQIRKLIADVPDAAMRQDFLDCIDDNFVATSMRELEAIEQIVRAALPPDDSTVFDNKEAAEAHLRQSVFPKVSRCFRLFKTTKLRQDEYIVVNRDWLKGLDSYQTYALDRDVNDRLHAEGLPLQVLYLPFPGAKGPTKLPLLGAWRREPTTQAERLNTFEYIPGGAEIVGHAFNTYKDVSVPARPGIDVTRMLDHMRDNLCRGNHAYYDYLIRWLAHMIQRPSERPMTGISIIGEQGTGKGILIELMSRVMGGRRNCNTTTSAKDTKSFNTAIAGKLMVVFDEATFSGDHEQSDFMKKLVTEPYVRIEPKGVDAYEVQNFARCFITSNNMESAVPADIGARRWLIIECRAMQDEGAWLRDLACAIGNNGEADPQAIPHFVNGFKHYLETLDLTGFNTRDLPMQDTGMETKMHNHYRRDAVYAFLCEWLCAPRLTLFRQMSERDREGNMHEFDVSLRWDTDVKFSDMYAVFMEMCKSCHGKAVGRNRIGRALAAFGIECFTRSGNECWVRLPKPVAVLAALRRSSRFDLLVTPEQEQLINEWGQDTCDLDAVISIMKGSRAEQQVMVTP